MKSWLPLIFFLFITSRGTTQCETFVNQTCLPQLGVYTDIGKKNVAVLLPGDTAEIGVTFYSTHHYRVVVCGQPELGKLAFRLLDKKGTVLFDNRNFNSPSFWDFNTQVTQNVKIQIIVPGVPSNQVAQTACVAVLVGFKGDAK